MDKLKNLLHQINLIVTRERTMKEERRKRGENFNVFSVLSLSRNETRLHSAFIAELLNPDGSHGLRDAFLKSFMQHIVPEFELETADAKVQVEFYIGRKNEDKTRGGRIDILVTDNRHRAVIIENKIDALEQERQLCRYNNYARDMGYADYRLLYLTPKGNDSETIDKCDRKYYVPISYRVHILNWLESCVGIAACHPLIRETVRQYIINLKEILNIMDSENEDKLVGLAASKEYIDSTLTLFKNEEKIKREIRLRFIEELKRLVERKGLKFNCDEHLCDLWNDQWVLLSNSEVSKRWAIYIGWDKQTQAGGTLYGIGRRVDATTPPLSAEQLAQLPHVWPKQQQNDYPCGWDYLWGKTGNWWDWRNVDTLRDMANGEMLRFIETEVIDKVIGGHLLEKVQEIIPD